MNITPESKVGEIAAQHPMATQVFARHGIDFCCGGGVALEQACSKRGLETPRDPGRDRPRCVEPARAPRRTWSSGPRPRSRT